MSQFRISSQAVGDIENIWKYVAQNNFKAADKLFDILRSTFPKLAKFPQMGKERPELASSLRSFPVKSYSNRAIAMRIFMGYNQIILFFEVEICKL